MNRTFIVALIQNAGLLLAMVVVFDYLTSRRDPIATPFRKALAGIAIGVVGIGMIVVSVPIEEGIIFDTRSVLLAVSGLFLGGWPTTIAMAMIILFRLGVGGEGGFTGVLVILASGSIGMIWRRLRRRPVEEVTWAELYALGILVHLVMLGLMFTLPAAAVTGVLQAVAAPVMVVHPLATVALGILFAQRLRNYHTREELSKSESLFRLLAENAGDLIFRYEFVPRRGFTYVSPSSVQLTGYTPEEHYEDPDLGLKIVHPEDRHLLEASTRGEPGEEGPLVLRWIRKDGEILWAEQRTTRIFDVHGTLVAIEGISRDVSENRRTEERLRLALKGAKQGFYDLDVQTGEATVSEEYARMLGFDPETFRESNDAWLARIHPNDVERVRAAYDDYIQGRSTEYRSEFRSRTGTGEWLWILSLGSIVSHDTAGRPLRMLGTHTDISALKNAEEQNRAAQAEMRLLLEDAERSRWSLLELVEAQKVTERELLAAQKLAQSTLDALKDYICVLDENGVIITVNEAWRELGVEGGARPESILAGASYLEVCDAATGNEAVLARQVAAALRAVLAGRAESFSMAYPCESPEKSRWFDLHITRFAGGGPTRVVVAHSDITDRKRAESELRRLTQILEASQAAARVGGWDLDLAQNTLFWTDETYRIHDISREEYNPTLQSAIRFFSPESVPILEEVLEEAREHGIARDVELELMTRTGARKWVQFTPTVTTERGRTVRVACAIQDITARKQAEQERLALTAQLHQAQKLESLGSLAGGVAHDINNVLAAIMSSASASRPRLQDTDPLARALDTIISACLRGRSVVRSLLYFARSDIGSRGPVDLNIIVRDIVDLLESTTLKRIQFTMHLQQPLPRIDGDRAALGHAVMNLCINSLDAMPEGGAVTITTRESQGGLVEISVSDTGSGMTPEVKGKAIEPFFTTKPLGEGTGLGLAMVYGTVKAHEGTLDIITSPGHGTMVVLRFPPGKREQPSGSATFLPAGNAASGSLRTLLVDDDDLIREGVGALLQMTGHQMHLAAGGDEAIALLESGLEVDLVLLDMNMPGMTGAETLPRLLELRPELHVLLCSGHRDEDMERLTGVPNVLSIQKPFTLEELEAKLTALGVQAGHSPPSLPDQSS
jgi:PAS domain S-box-containing protein